MLRRGITFPELIIVFGMVLILMTFISLRVVPSQRRTSLSETLAVLASDARQQQLKAMHGASLSGQGSAYGVRFFADGYTLFTGDSFDPDDSGNYEVPLDPGFTFSRVDFPGSALIFSRGSGEISAFINDPYDLVLTDDQEGTSQTITFNRYGAIIQITF